MWSKFAEVQCAFAVAEVRKVTAHLSQTCGFAVAEHLWQFCGICGCGIECKFAVPSLPKVNTCCGHTMFSFAGVKLWSKLDPDLKSLGWLSFKKHFKRKRLQKYDD